MHDAHMSILLLLVYMEYGQYFEKTMLEQKLVDVSKSG